MGRIEGSSLADYGRATYLANDFTCVYCGFDGRPFDAWMQLSIDHILPKNSGGGEGPENLVVACRSCNSITSRMKFNRGTPREVILKAKRDQVAKRRRVFYDHWKEFTAPRYLDRELPPLR